MFCECAIEGNQSRQDALRHNGFLSRPASPKPFRQGAIMKNVTFSTIVHIPATARSRFSLRTGTIRAEGQPGRLDVTTRFQACHLVGTLDDALGKLGYAPAARAPGSLRYHTCTPARLLAWPAARPADIAVTVHAHALEVTGPMAALQALRTQLAC
jgi:hypothetical protein